MKVINEIKYLSQRDPEWASFLLGGGSLTVGRYGCTTTAISMLTDYFDCYQDPGQIARTLTNYTPGDSNINWIGLNFPNFSFRWREGHLFSDANNEVDINMVYAYLAPNPDRAVLLEVANRSHWVVGLWKTYDNDILAIDPWTGRTCEVFKEYKNITGAALFVRSKKNEWRGKMKPQAPDYK